MIQLIHVVNPLQPSVGRVAREVEPVEKLEGLLLHYFDRSEIDGFTVSINGRVWPRSLWSELQPRDGDCIVCAPKVAGGSVLRTLAQVAVVAASIAVGAVSAGAGFALMGLSSAVTSSVLAGAVSIAGTLLISAFLSTPSKKGSSPSYAFDGPSSLAQSGTVIPKGYGTFLNGGNIISSFIDVEGSDQYLNVLVCYGYGPARSISGITINGKPAKEYGNVQFYTRPGSNTQTPIPNFNRIVNGYPQDAQCLAGVPVTVPGTGDLTSILQVDVVFPSGLWVLTNDNNLIPATLTYLVEWAVAGSGSWQPALYPAATEDVVTYMLDGNPNPYPTWCAVATDLPPGLGVVYDTSSGSHYAGEPFSTTEGVTIVYPNGDTGSYTKTCVGEWQLTQPNINQVIVSSWTAGYQSATFCQQTPCYQRTTIYVPSPGKYDVRITKYGSGRWGHAGDISPGDNWSPQVGQDMWAHNVNEISLLDLAYPNMILVGVRALATGQLSGSSLNILALVEYGLRSKDNNILPTALQAFEEDNPACVAADMMLDRLYGGGQWPGIVAANIDRFIDEWVAWAELNDQLVDDGNGHSIRRHVFNGIFDNESNLWEQLNAVCRMSRAQIIPMGRDYGVFLDQPDTPVQIFTMGNIAQDSYTETWMQIDDRANQVEIQFADSTRYYKQDNPLVYMDPANQDAGMVVKNVRIDGKGITIPAQAWHLARFKELCNQYLLRTGSFRTDVDGIACRPGNVIILQHDVPEWGFGGRTLPGSTASAVVVDRSDLPFDVAASYSLVVLQPSIQRYAGTVTAVAAVIDGTGANLGTLLTLSSFDNNNRVTRCVVTVAGVQYDSPITASSAGQITIQPCAGFTAAAAQSYALYDTDVLDAASVTGVTMVDGIQTVQLATPLQQAPPDYSTYFYGVTGSQKLPRVVNIKKASEFRATIEWIDYDARCYVDATPIIGETSAQIASNPGVTTLTGREVLQRISGSYISSVSLNWQNGPDTVGVGIYAAFINPATGAAAGPAQMIARLTNNATIWTQQVQVGQIVRYTVVGFDVNNYYAGFKSAPSVTVAFEGIAANLLLGSTFQSGFAYWNTTARAGDTLAADLSNDGEATYTVAGTALTAAQTLLFQIVPASKWTAGGYLMLSAYLEDSAVSTANVGSLMASIVFLDSSGAQISKVSAIETMNGTAPLLNRYYTASTAVPAGTVSVVVVVEVGGTGLSIPVGSVLTFSHLLLEASTSTQTLPSLWADVDAQGQVEDFFTTGSSSGLRAQASVLPSFTGSFNVSAGTSSMLITWTGLALLWPDGGTTYVADATSVPTGIEAVGLTVSTTYFVYLYWDVIQARVNFVAPTTPVGTSILYGVDSGGMASAAYDAVADAACNQDGRVSLTPGGMQITTAASGTVTLRGGGSSAGGGVFHGTSIPSQAAPGSI